MSRTAVLAEDVHVRFGGVHALAGIDLAAPARSTLAVLGHDGARKTTLIRVLTTLIAPDAGRVRVDGFDVVADPDHVRRRIAVTGQYAGVDEYLTGREDLELRQHRSETARGGGFTGRAGNRSRRDATGSRRAPRGCRWSRRSTA
jgi:ABC-2 type transport system ATP-binding protein